MGSIRLLLALFVLVAHTESFFGVTFMGGNVAVEIFFIISGFYMTMILNEKYIGKGSYGIFIENRFLKIYPIYWVVLICTLFAFIVLWLVFHNDNGFRFYIDNYNSLDTISKIFIIFSNIFIFGQDILMFLGVDHLGSLVYASDFSQTNPKLYKALFIPQAWTLGIELSFYIIAPFIVRRSLRFIWLLLIASFMLRGYIYYHLDLTNDPWTHRFFLSELSLFLMGTLAYRLYRQYEIKNYHILFFIYMIIVFNFLFYNVLYGNLKLLNNWGLYILFTVALPYIFQLFKKSKIDRFIGEFSYPIYVSHVAIAGIIHFILRKFSLLEYWSELTFLISFLFSFFLIKYILQPIEKTRRNNLMSKVKQ